MIDDFETIIMLLVLVLLIMLLKRFEQNVQRRLILLKNSKI